VGPPITTTVPITDGLFTVSLDFGDEVFTGDARWIEIAVRCPAGSGDYSPLTPRQALTPAPYALALPGLWTQQNGTSPNLIGGYIENTVVSGTVGATIGGGGVYEDFNEITTDYGTIAGGRGNYASGVGVSIGGGDNNTASGAYAAVGGGAWNQASGPDATVGGGRDNSASEESATVSGGWWNKASAPYATIGGGHHITVTGEAATVGGGRWITVTAIQATVGGGQLNAASGNWSTIGGGSQNAASGNKSTLSGGQLNTASGELSTIGGGGNNVAGGGRSTIGGGASNVTNSGFSTIPGGRGAETSLYGQMAYASGGFDSPGQAQASLYVLRNITNDATETALFLDGVTKTLTIATNRTLTFDILVTASSDGGQSAGYSIQGVIENVGGTTAFVGSPSVVALGEDDTSWDVSVQADDGWDTLVVKVTGAAGTNIRWVATVRTAEVSW
jgi:hypothetical protein